MLSILHLLRQLLPRLYPRSQREKDRKKRIIDVLYDCYHLYAEDPDPNPEFEQLEAFTHFVYKQMEANKVKVWRGVVAAGLRECPYATSITWHLVSNLIGEKQNIYTKSLKIGCSQGSSTPHWEGKQREIPQGTHMVGGIGAAWLCHSR